MIYLARRFISKVQLIPHDVTIAFWFVIVILFTQCDFVSHKCNFISLSNWILRCDSLSCSCDFYLAMTLNISKLQLYTSQCVFMYHNCDYIFRNYDNESQFFFITIVTFHLKCSFISHNAALYLIIATLYLPMSIHISQLWICFS